MQQQPDIRKITIKFLASTATAFTLCILLFLLMDVVGHWRQSNARFFWYILFACALWSLVGLAALLPQRKLKKH